MPVMVVARLAIWSVKRRRPVFSNAGNCEIKNQMAFISYPANVGECSAAIPCASAAGMPGEFHAAADLTAELASEYPVGRWHRRPR